MVIWFLHQQNQDVEEPKHHSNTAYRLLVKTSSDQSVHVNKLQQFFSF